MPVNSLLMRLGLVVVIGGLVVANVLALATRWAAQVLSVAAAHSGWITVPWVGWALQPPWMVLRWYVEAFKASVRAGAAPGILPGLPTLPPAGPLILTVGALAVWYLVILWAWRSRSGLQDDIYGSARFAQGSEVRPWFGRRFRGRRGAGTLRRQDPHE
jgi:hypothetical protein